MDALRFGLGVVLPYLAVTVFLAGMLYRVYVWKRLPSPPITLFPAPATEAANLVNTLREAALFRSLFHGDRLLWALAWGFHAVLALILLGHSRAFANVDRVLEGLGMSAVQIQAMSGGVGGAAGLVIGVAALALLGRRLVAPRARQVTGVSDCLALLLIGAIVTTGNLLRFGPEHFDLGLTRSYFAALATLSDVTGAAALRHNLFVAHMTLAFALLMLMPFSKLLHFGGIFFTHQLLRRH